jgi:hypothetical protein
MWNQELMLIADTDSSGIAKKRQAEDLPDEAIPAPMRKRIKTLNPQLGSWDVNLSESSDDEDAAEKPKKVRSSFHN